MDKIGSGASGKIVIEVVAEDGRILNRLEEKMHSYTLNFINTVYGAFTGGNYAQIKDTDGNLATPSYPFDINAPANNDSYGILIGTGNTTPGYDDYKLENKIGNSEMSYGETKSETWIEDLNNEQSPIGIKVTRSFINQTSNTINVNEVGIAYKSNNATNYFLITRDVLSSAASVPSNATLNVTVYLEYNPSS